ncbi:MAG: inositol monophosphatase [Actinomycetota bacterium]|jgi:myo-inositol-1(or 4)-monophosphatase|nr:inositol monophosphatase [Euzebyaceae bacterium]MDQ3453810.1 inositol monophosphatase [Actinomycetota bacterium]
MVALDTSALLDLAVEVATAAGNELLSRRDDAGQVDHKSSATDPVSEADRAAERRITEALSSARPDDGLLGEEGADRHGSTGLRWVIDPLDGTVNYLYGIPAWSVSIACEDEHGALVGAVIDPSRQETFSAVRHQGASRNGQPLRVNEPVELAGALLATGFSYDSEIRRRQAATLAFLLPQVRDIRRIGSAALDLCAVAAGRVDAYYEDTTARWDWAAGALVATEAGAVVTPLASGLLAAGPSLHTGLSALLAEAQARA